MCYTCAFRLFLYLHRNTAHIVACISKLFVWVGGLVDDFVISYTCTAKKNDDFFFLFNSHLFTKFTYFRMELHARELQTTETDGDDDQVD